MPRKKFEQADDAMYDPFAAENKRAAIRAATGHIHETEPSDGGGESVVTLVPPTPAPEPTSSSEPESSGAASVEVKEPAVEARPEAEPEVKAEVEAPADRKPSPAVPTLEKTTSQESRALARESQRQNVQKRFRVTHNEEEDYEAFVLRLRKAASSKVDFSVVSRALWSVVQHAEHQVLEELKRTHVPMRPGKHDPIPLAEYEELWVRILSSALRKMPPVK